jgi:hypothetical protein
MKLRHCLSALCALSTLSAALVVALPAAAQQHAAPAPGPGPYAGEQSRPIKALAERDVAGLLAGSGAGYAKAAELNGYPGPAHVIELRDRLALSGEQLQASQALMAGHQARARALGRELVDAERRLDALFAGRRAQADAVDAATADIGRLQARLRAEHLNTHLQQTALLRPEQVQAYNEARGYTAAAATGSAAPARPHSGHH